MKVGDSVVGTNVRPVVMTALGTIPQEVQLVLTKSPSGRYTFTGGRPGVSTGVETATNAEDSWTPEGTRAAEAAGIEPAHTVNSGNSTAEDKKRAGTVEESGGTAAGKGAGAVTEAAVTEEKGEEAADVGTQAASGPQPGVDDHYQEGWNYLWSKSAYRGIPAWDEWGQAVNDRHLYEYGFEALAERRKLDSKPAWKPWLAWVRGDSYNSGGISGTADLKEVAQKLNELKGVNAHTGQKDKPFNPQTGFTQKDLNKVYRAVAASGGNIEAALNNINFNGVGVDEQAKEAMIRKVLMGQDTGIVATDEKATEATEATSEDEAAGSPEQEAAAAGMAPKDIAELVVMIGPVKILKAQKTGEIDEATVERVYNAWNKKHPDRSVSYQDVLSVLASRGIKIKRQERDGESGRKAGAAERRNEQRATENAAAAETVASQQGRFNDPNNKNTTDPLKPGVVTRADGGYVEGLKFAQRFS
jgi:hypothetical protein